MRKQTKIAAIVTAAALLAIGASMTSFAATGWQEENGTWVYYDRDGELETEQWEKSGDQWFYLNDDGEMATDVIIEDDDDYYYVDANGAMVSNTWIEIENEDAGDDDEPDTFWYYFGSNGKAYQGKDDGVSLKTINGKKYTFNEEGQMQYGWVEKDEGETNYDDDAWQTCQYYFGDETDGAMSVGWREISITDEDADDEDVQPGDSYWDEDQDRWFYFKSSGKKQTDETGKKINGQKYAFDEYGRMVADWYTATTLSDATTSDFMYFSTPEDGARYSDGWFKVVPGYFLDEDDYDDGEENWYYADGDGELVANEIKSINGKKYAFDDKGVMMDGLVILEMDGTKTIVSKLSDDDDTYPYDTEDDFKDFYSGTDSLDARYLEFDDSQDTYLACYYFGDGDDGSMKTGKETVEIDGDDCSFKFKSSGSHKGQGYCGREDDRFYRAGLLAKAGSDDKVLVVYYDDTTKEVQTYTVDEYLALTRIKPISKEYTSDLIDYDEDYDIYVIDGTTYQDDYYVINTSGNMISSGTKTDGDDYKVKIKSDHINYIKLEK